MLQAQIVPKYLNPRSERGGASVKDVNGVKWFCPDQALSLFQPNVAANVIYEQKTPRSGGRPYNTITVVNGQPVSQNMQQAGQAYAPTPFLPPQPLPPPTPQYPQPSHEQAEIARAAAAQKMAIAETEAKDRAAKETLAEEIFVTGIVGRTMGSGQFGIADIRHLAKEATQAWRERNQPMAYQAPTDGPGQDQEADPRGNDGWPGPIA